MKIRKIVLVVIVMLFAFTPVHATSENTEITPKAFAYIWPTSYETIDFIHFYNIVYRTVTISQRSNYAFDTCYGTPGYRRGYFIPLPIYTGHAASSNTESIQQTDYIPSSCQLTYQYQVGVGAIEYIENPITW